MTTKRGTDTILLAFWTSSETTQPTDEIFLSMSVMKPCPVCQLFRSMKQHN